MIPQPGREGGFSTQGLQANAVIPWSITKVEKQKYDQVFEGWDGLRRGLISGDTAIEVFGQSGLPKDNLMQIWTLADSGNKGSLNKDEFAVAMHLVSLIFERDRKTANYHAQRFFVSLTGMKSRRVFPQS